MAANLSFDVCQFWSGKKHYFLCGQGFGEVIIMQRMHEYIVTLATRPDSPGIMVHVIAIELFAMNLKNV